ncbi:MAG: TIGR01458 family HAD-type hydrolase [Zetaproteobacteria bacterium CG_4_9_14_3_um_filter_49_83]|nr:MAG: haloacid dehalogenase [Zetaproteobacteria bacterium CG1_02_49_23]PIQ34343.1 MAG: TIGR01458 family HAD-type hydrolase [Zetaproteobacteria bacterium CG17_big_fil_post_rev_8_21_14_2_50_50_13]PIV29906.1 MAG: TIGR01458 family HAD-type hydrolase [Zetaproteobacteria bacterium CG02_land_8_20_14_3_00_50_9]PIY56153.1 MAG: TIGR01458 family HAD-type hydrolase [Zetaproteobacteria bacterium CG_4_10_14_0_8_um_filter_49_80]PJA35378.1 MAG: TIGR01458 family HAD-type hydrolase [Zetaproteobacteria bacteriu
MGRKKRQHTTAVLFDLDGVLYVGDKIIEGADQVVHQLKSLGLKIAGVTNTTTQPVSTVAAKLARLGIPIFEEEIYTPAALAVQAIGQHSVKLYVRDALLEDFQGLTETTDVPDFIVMGDLGGDAYTPALLQEIFRYVMQGSEVLALHKNRFWQKPDGLHMDIGPFVSAIEYATGKTASVLGKPSRAFFHGVCEALGVRPASTLMIGDDIESDIDGARRAGLKTALVKTGKYRAEFVRQTTIKPDLVIPSVADLVDAMQLVER